MARLTHRIVVLTTETAPCLDCLADEVFDAPPDPDLVADYLSDPAQRTFLALAGDLVIGQCKTVIHRHPDKAPNIYIEELGVGLDWRRRGVARDLLSAAEAYARSAGCAELWLATETDNAAANALYGAVGLEGQRVVMWSRIF